MEGVSIEGLYRCDVAVTFSDGRPWLRSSYAWMTYIAQANPPASVGAIERLYSAFSIFLSRSWNYRCLDRGKVTRVNSIGKMW
jgi:hypothetical protein